MLFLPWCLSFIFIALSGGYVLKETAPSRQDGLYHTKKTFCKSFFSKNAKKVLREFHAKLSSLAHFLLTRLRRLVKEKLFHHTRLYLSYLLDEILYYQIQHIHYNLIFAPINYYLITCYSCSDIACLF